MRRRVVVVAFAVMSACSGGGDSPTQPTLPPTPPTPAAQSIVLTLPSGTLSVGQTQVATATAKDAAGNTLTGATVTWASRSPGVADITASGAISAIAPGADTITATVGAVTTSAALVITAPPPPPAGVVALSMQPGEVQSFSVDTAMHGLQVPARGTRSQYVFVVADADTTAGVKKPFGVTLDSGSSVSPSASRAPQLAYPSGSVQTPGSLQNAMEARIRNYERTYLGPRMSGGLTISRDMNVPRPARATNDYATGSIAKIHVPGQTGDFCNSYVTIGAKVLAVSTKAIIMMDTTATADADATASAVKLAQEFDTIIYPTDTHYFGTPTDKDGNGKVLIVLTPEVNKQTSKTSSSAGYLGGFFFAGDLYPPSLCPESNGGEIFYMAAPDPEGKFGVAHPAAAIEQSNRGTVAHEFQHMINAGQRLANAAGFEDSWLDEALAHFAEDVNGRAADGLSEAFRVTEADVQKNQANYSAFFFENIARYQMWLSSAGSIGATSGASSSLAVRGAGWSFLLNAASLASPNDFAQLTRRLVQSKETGIKNIVTSSGKDFSTLVGTWAVANAYSLVSMTGATHTYPSYDFYNIFASGQTGAAPPLLQLRRGMPLATSVVSADAVYFQVGTTGAAVSQTVRFTNSSGSGAVSIPTSRVYVVRVQ